MSVASMNPLSISPIDGLSDEINTIRMETAKILTELVIPQEDVFSNYFSNKRKSLTHELQQHVKSVGLWTPHLPKEYGGMGISFLAQAYMNEIMSWSPYASSVFGISAPNAGNQKLLVKYGTEEQKRKWLEPLVSGDMKSCFSMTEPDSPGSDPRSLKTTARKEGDEWVINGRKWFTTDAQNSDFAIVMCRTEDDSEGGDQNARMTQIIVPTNTPGFKIERNIPMFGVPISDHFEITYTDVRVPIENQLGGRGTGHDAAQDRLGAGRVFHCMNCIGQMWRAFDLMVKRLTEREVHGGLLETKQLMQEFIAESYIDIQQARLMTIHCAETIDSGKDARTMISAIKISVPRTLERVVDRAIQVYGGMGLSGDVPLYGMMVRGRTLRIADGPDEVHKILIAKNVLSTYHDGNTWDFGS